MERQLLKNSLPCIALETRGCVAKATMLSILPGLALLQPDETYMKVHATHTGNQMQLVEPLHLTHEGGNSER